MLRRTVISLIGFGAAALGGIGLSRFAAWAQPTDALEPWLTAGEYEDARMAALSWAILAPSPHNLQPWLADLVGEDELTIWRDTDVALPETDPSDRLMMISMGAFLEILRQAFAQQGLLAEVVLFPDGDTGPVAHVTMRAGGSPDPLFMYVRDRRTNCQPYEDRLPDSRSLGVIGNEASEILTDPETVSQLSDLAWNAMQTEIATERVQAERVSLMRFGKDEINANPDGITFRGPMIEALSAMGLVTRDGQSDPTSLEFQFVSSSIKNAMAATPAYVCLKTKTNTKADQIEAGRRLLRLGLAATAENIAFQPLTQGLQEYPEQDANRAGLYDVLAQPGETV